MAKELVDPLRELLERSGWSEERRIDLSEMEAGLAARGLRLNDGARMFLERFGGLSIRDDSPSHLRLETDPVEAVGDVEPGDIEAAEKKIGAGLTPIAATASGMMVMLMDDHGRAFGLERLSGDLFILAESGTALLNGLFLGMEYRQVIDNDRWDRRQEQAAAPPPAHATPAPTAPSDETWEEGVERRIREKLDELGWDHDKPRPQADTIKAGGSAFPVPPRVKAFLERYDGLRRAGYSKLMSSSVIVWVAPTVAAYQVSPDEVKDYEGDVGARLCPIGECGFGQRILFMDEHGRAFTSNTITGDLYMVAEDEAELLDFLLLDGGTSVPVTAEEHWENWRRTRG